MNRKDLYWKHAKVMASFVNHYSADLAPPFLPCGYVRKRLVRGDSHDKTVLLSKKS